MIAHGKKYHDIVVSLDGCTFVDCTFERCKLLYSGLMPCQMSGNTVTDCEWQFVGPAANTIQFMTATYAGLSRELIEGTFESIRRNAAGGGQQRRAGDPVVLNS